MAYKFILKEIQDKICTITLNRLTLLTPGYSPDQRLNVV